MGVGNPGDECFHVSEIDIRMYEMSDLNRELSKTIAVDQGSSIPFPTKNNRRHLLGTFLYSLKNTSESFEIQIKKDRFGTQQRR